MYDPNSRLKTENNIRYNLEHDQDKDASITVYMTVPMREAIEAFADRTQQSLSDACGGLLLESLKAVSYTHLTLPTKRIV